MLCFEQDVNFSIIFNHEKSENIINTCTFYVSMFQLCHVNFLLKSMYLAKNEAYDFAKFSRSILHKLALFSVVENSHFFCNL